MKTTTSIKIDPKLKAEASELAKEMGLTLSAIITFTLKQYVRDRRLVLDVEPKLSAQKEKDLLAMKEDVKHGRNLSRTYSDTELDELFADLKI